MLELLGWVDWQGNVKLSEKGKRNLLERKVRKPKSTFIDPQGSVLVQLLKRNALKTHFSNTSVLYHYIKENWPELILTIVFFLCQFNIKDDEWNALSLVNCFGKTDCLGIGDVFYQIIYWKSLLKERCFY